MAEYNDPPPPYSQSPDLPPPSSPPPYSPPTAPTVDYNLPLFEGTAPPPATATATTQHTRNPENRQARRRIYPDALEEQTDNNTCTENLIEKFQNELNTFSGFIDILHDKEKLLQENVSMTDMMIIGNLRELISRYKIIIAWEKMYL